MHFTSNKHVLVFGPSKNQNSKPWAHVSFDIVSIAMYFYKLQIKQNLSCTEKGQSMKMYNHLLTLYTDKTVQERCLHYIIIISIIITSFQSFL